ncbi:MAG: catalase family protein [Janthinobacterium lividum]
MQQTQRPIPVAYQASFEYLEEDEQQSIDGLREVFVKQAHTVAEKEGHAHRAVHAKGQGLLKGRLKVVDGLADEYRQGLFSTPQEFDALVRLSSLPAEQLPDSVTTPRAIAVKVLQVPGERVPESSTEHTQDFLMVNGPAFTRPGPKGFLRDSKLLASTTEKAPKAKQVLSAVMRGAEAVIEAVGGESGLLKNMGGQPHIHPLGETYFTQAPFLYGPYIAKFSLEPASQSLKSLKDQKLDASDDDAQRDVMNDFFSSASQTPAVWNLRVQLCTDIEKMPIEDASVEWDQELSPFVTVATLTLPAQRAWQAQGSEKLEDEIAFSPWHALAAHRPLGALNRARRVVMAASREFRASFNGCPIHEPRIEAMGHTDLAATRTKQPGA